jgi:hypothetical protein
MPGGRVAGAADRGQGAIVGPWNGLDQGRALEVGRVEDIGEIDEHRLALAVLRLVVVDDPAVPADRDQGVRGFGVQELPGLEAAVLEGAQTVRSISAGCGTNSGQQSCTPNPPYSLIAYWGAWLKRSVQAAICWRYKMRRTPASSMNLGAFGLREQKLRLSL